MFQNRLGVAFTTPFAKQNAAQEGFNLWTINDDAF
jgi:hypothetical protein